jgi:prevent-host-death family protein
VREIASSAFKARCLALLDEVAATGEEIVITKRGKPIAKLGALSKPAPLLGSVRFLVSPADLVGPTGETWEAESS